MEFETDAFASLDGEPFTGWATVTEGAERSAQAFVGGVARGPEILWDPSGQVTYVGFFSLGRIMAGPSHQWDGEGHLVSEHVNDFSGDPLLSRSWDASGRLVHEERYSASPAGSGQPTGEHGSRPWRRIRVAAGTAPPEPGGAAPVPRVEDLRVSRTGADGPLVLLHGRPFTGEAVTRDPWGRTEMHTFVEGVEDGVTLTWSPGGALVTQGITRYPHGPVGPWHQWDERGRLLRETVHDALGNRIIVRELDEAGDIVREERRPPARLARDPRTGQERPATWL
ncbi:MULTISPECIES: hypothetical protein [unclassified Nocardiopsis]|uniref:hypothetical protein n=1 Tax=unclassified Nocardiopsis TaxID=2649073 RepID=UPI001F318534|nr:MULTISPECIES: hypothetical protein [unclassified Nocardiopsis]